MSTLADDGVEIKRGLYMDEGSGARIGAGRGQYKAWLGGGTSAHKPNPAIARCGRDRLPGSSRDSPPCSSVISTILVPAATGGGQGGP